MNFNPGMLNKKIELLRYADIEGPLGTTSKGLEPVIQHKIWARVEPAANSRNYLDESKVKTEDLFKITIRYRSGIGNDMLIRYKNSIFAIQNISDPDERHELLILICSVKDRGDVNHAS